MTMYTCTTICLLVTLSWLYSAEAQQQNCQRSRFNCDFNNPCDPLCVPGQFHYPGQGPSRYISCEEGTCSTHRCPRGTQWDQGDQRCEANGKEARCAFSHFTCDNPDRNPCAPTLCTPGVFNYTGTGPKKYVVCGAGGTCSEERCPRRLVWNQGRQTCVKQVADGGPGVQG